MDVKVNGITLHYESKGDGPALILTPGLAQNSLIWKDYIGPLSKDFQVITWDVRGSGQSDSPPEPYTMELFATDLIGLMDHLKIDAAHLLGNSMGSAISLTACLKFPERVKKAILCVPFNQLRALAKYQMDVVTRLFSQDLSLEMIMRTQLPWLYSNDFLADPKKVDKKIEEFLKNPYPQPAEGYLGQLNALTHFHLEDELKKIPHECLIIAGENDLLTPSENAEKLCDLILGAELTILQGQGHALQDEKYKEVIELTHRFLLME